MGNTKTVAIDEDYHAQLGRIAILDKVSKGEVVERMIEKDGRGKIPEARKMIPLQSASTKTASTEIPKEPGNAS